MKRYYKVKSYTKRITKGVKRLTLQLRKIRESRGISQTYIAKKLGYKHASGYSNIEAGIRKLDVVKAKKIADILNCDIEDFFCDEITQNVK